MKFKAMLLGLTVITALPAFAQKPVYLDTGKPIEERVKDASVSYTHLTLPTT